MKLVRVLTCDVSRCCHRSVRKAFSQPPELSHSLFLPLLLSSLSFLAVQLLFYLSLQTHAHEQTLPDMKCFKAASPCLRGQGPQRSRWGVEGWLIPSETQHHTNTFSRTTLSHTRTHTHTTGRGAGRQAMRCDQQKTR